MYKDIIDTIGFVERYDPELGAAMQRELGRQRQNIELIASENIVSPAVTTPGMGPDEMKVIADCIADCVFDFANKKDEVARKVEELTKKFPLYE